MFDRGARVRTRLCNPAQHTRLPAYLRDKPGEIVADLGLFPFADERAAGRTAPEQRVYSVRFDARDLFGPDAQPRSAIYADLFESYLEPVA